jgi:GT2 family glycosyltransferase
MSFFVVIAVQTSDVWNLLPDGDISNLSQRVHIILLNWNGWRDTAQCISSLGRMQSADARIVVVDNGSTDNSVERLKALHPEIGIVETGRNLGFAAGCNVGIRQAVSLGADYIWLLNNDTIVSPEALYALIAKAESDARLGAVGSAVYAMDKPHQLQAWGGGYVNFWLGRSRHFVQSVPDEKIDFLTGASLFLRRSALLALGLLDEGFFMYWEDADYCFRLRKEGWKLGVAGESKIWHRGSASVGKASSRLDAYFNTSAARFFRKHAPMPRLSLWSGVTLRLTKRALLGDWERFGALWTAVRQADAVQR